MTRLVFATISKTDVVALLTYLKDVNGPKAAAKLDTSLENLYDLLRDHPQSCPARPKLGRHVRMGIISPYVVLYRYDSTADVVTVLRVLDGRRRISAKLIGKAAIKGSD